MADYFAVWNHVAVLALVLRRIRNLATDRIAAIPLAITSLYFVFEGAVGTSHLDWVAEGYAAENQKDFVSRKAAVTVRRRFAKEVREVYALTVIVAVTRCLRRSDSHALR